MPDFDESTTLTLLALLFAAFALLMLFGLLRALRRRRPLRATTLVLGAGGFGLAAALCGSIALNLLTYQRLTQERSVAQLSFAQLAPQRFEVELRLADGSSRRLTLTGDEWQLDARVLKWSGLATVLGFDPLFRLERLSGRYLSAAQELSAARTVHGFAGGRGVDLWAAARLSDGWMPWVDALYGSAAYLPMRDGARYGVTISGSGLVARPLNEAAAAAIADWK